MDGQAEYRRMLPRFTERAGRSGPGGKPVCRTGNPRTEPTSRVPVLQHVRVQSCCPNPTISIGRHDPRHRIHVRWSQPPVLIAKRANDAGLAIQQVDGESDQASTAWFASNYGPAIRKMDGIGYRHGNRLHIYNAASGIEASLSEGRCIKGYDGRTVECQNRAVQKLAALLPSPPKVSICLPSVPNTTIRPGSPLAVT